MSYFLNSIVLLFHCLQVVLGTLISYFARLHETFNVTILGDIPVG